MSAVTHDHAAGVSHSVARAVSHVKVTLPATARVRAAALADFHRSHGLDLDDDDRAAKVRAKRR